MTFKKHTVSNAYYTCFKNTKVPLIWATQPRGLTSHCFLKRSNYLRFIKFVFYEWPLFEKIIPHYK